MISAGAVRGIAAALGAAMTVVAVTGCGSSSTDTTETVPASTAPAATQSASGPGSGKPAVTIGTKNFTEELILGQLYAQALRAKGYTVTVKPNIGDSEAVAGEMAAGRVSGYPEYTGTILSVLAKDSRRPASAAQAYARAAAYERGKGVELLAMAPAEDKNALVTTPAYSASHHVSSLGDLAGSSATLAGPSEFRTRYDGLVGMKEAYGITGVNFRPVDIGKQYDALHKGQADLIAVFTTDGELSQGGYKLLGDPRQIFGFQNVTFAVRRDVARREGPEFTRTINSVSEKLSTQALRLMNAAVELDQQSPAPVARQFLAANGLA
jgi:osmoprotectant transport system substrate-binding protein